MTKAMICLWYDKDAEEAAFRFYSKTFLDSAMGAVQRRRRAISQAAKRVIRW